MDNELSFFRIVNVDVDTMLYQPLKYGSTTRGDGKEGLEGAHTVW
jgi:hypothetical protein